MANVVRILSIDGGGIRGIIPALVLQYLEERTGKPISNLFHMVAGTSTGGILACALCARKNDGHPQTAENLVDLYAKQGQEIFKKSFWHGFGSLGGMVDEKYEADNLERILKNFMGDTLLSQVRGDLLVTSYDINKREPHFFKSWKARGERLRKSETSHQRDFHLRAVARATSAAPTYFEPAFVKNMAGVAFPLVDGGVFANNPAMCALASARRIYPGRTRFLIVSIGTGQTQREIPYQEAKNWGLLGWARPILYILMDGVADAVNYQLAQEFPPRDYFRFQIDIPGDADVGDAPNDDMDDARPENIQKLKALAQQLIQRQRPSLNRLVNQLKQPLTPRHIIADRVSQ